MGAEAIQIGWPFFISQFKIYLPVKQHIMSYLTLTNLNMKYVNWLVLQKFFTIPLLIILFLYYF